MWTAAWQRRFGLPRTAGVFPPPDYPTEPDEPIQSGAATPQSKIGGAPDLGGYKRIHNKREHDGLSPSSPSSAA